MRLNTSMGEIFVFNEVAGTLPSFTPNEVILHTEQNSILNINRSWVPDWVHGNQTFTDDLNNTWEITYSGTVTATVHFKCTDPNNNIIFDETVNNSSVNSFVFLTYNGRFNVEGVEKDSISLCVYSSVDYNHTTGATWEVNYYRGDNGVTHTTYSADLDKISDDTYSYVKLCNFIDGDNFDSITGVFREDSSGEIHATTLFNFSNGKWQTVFIPTGIVRPESTDPYEPGGASETGGGTGTFDGTGDDIEIPSLPTLSAVDAGFITLFNPTLSEMNSLASYMWSDPLFDVAAWKKIFADPMDAILGLSIVPVAVPDGGTKTVTVGNISTGVTMTYAASQYVEVDCGTLNVEEYWGAYLDYDPYTKAEIYLPYIGTHPLAVDDIMGKAVRVVYHVDILSGSCCAYVKCGGSVLYTFLGQCSSSIPITGDNWTNVINGAMNIAGAIGSMVATGGASAPMALGTIASTTVNQMKPSIERSGSMSGTGGMLAVQTPYLILTRPRQAIPENQNVFMGYPSFITSLLSDLSGYTEIESVHLENIPATNAELSEIETLLKSGVLL